MNYINPLTLFRPLICIIAFNVMMAATITVDQGGSGNHTTISAAVSAASSGDIIQVNSGLYLENVYLSGKDLTINGADPSSTTIYTSLVAIENTNSSLTISGLKIWSTTTTALSTHTGGNLTATNCLIQSDGFYAVHINNIDTATITDCTTIADSDDYNIYVLGSDLNVINSQLLDGSHGIYADNSAINIINSTIHDMNFGIQTHTGSTANIINSIIQQTSSQAVLVSSGSGNVVITNTLIFKSDIAVKSYENVTIQNSIIYDANRGLYTWASGGSYGLILSAFNCFYSISSDANTYTGDDASYYPTGLNDLVGTDPLFVDIDQGNNLLTDLTLQSSSPCIDTGNYSPVYNDLDGSRNDMGIYGGPNSWSASKPIVTNLQISPSSVTPGQSITIQATGKINN